MALYKLKKKKKIEKVNGTQRISISLILGNIHYSRITVENKEAIVCGGGGRGEAGERELEVGTWRKKGQVVYRKWEKQEKGHANLY